MAKRSKLSQADTLQGLRRQATELILEQSAILVLANHPDRLAPNDIREQVDAVNCITKHRLLRSMIGQLDTAVRQQRRAYGVTTSRIQLFALMDWLQKNVGPTQACYIPAGTLADYLSVYADSAFPPHARISIDPLCINKGYPGGFELRILEASLYEDMCILFNESIACQQSIPRDMTIGSLERKLAAKKHAAIMRATISAAFYFVEAYINCAAVDHVHKHKGKLPDKHLALLTEWDAAKNRSKFVSIRDKLVHYPRIITKAEHPPIDETNCPDMHYFLTSAKDFRDAIVHASASLDVLEDYPKKEHLVGTLNQEDVANVVDSAIRLVAKIDTIINGRPQKWIQSRNEEGLFSNKVFE